MLNQPAAPAARIPLILVVDPDEDTRALYRESLRLAAFDIDEAVDGRDALAKAVGRQPGIVITETRLPYIDGYTLCELLRRDGSTRDTHIIVITGDSRLQERERALVAGADSVLVKPCLPDRLLREMERFVPGDRPRRLEERARMASAMFPKRIEPSGGLSSGSGASSTTRARAYQRFRTTTPAVMPPGLVCPRCDRPLVYEQSEIGGVSRLHAEQWDYFSCSASCGRFQYRQRTRKLRQVE